MFVEQIGQMQLHLVAIASEAFEVGIQARRDPSSLTPISSVPPAPFAKPATVLTTTSSSFLLICFSATSQRNVRLSSSRSFSPAAISASSSLGFAGAGGLS